MAKRALPFIGRDEYLKQLDEVVSGGSSGGALLAIRGRRRVGKSRLVQEWLDRRGLPYVFYQATRDAEPKAVADFSRDVATSTLGSAATFQAGVVAAGWEGALRIIASNTSPARPVVVVIDEFPWLKEKDPGIEATIQKIWDRVIERKAPVILILIGSDIRMMKMLTAYGAPLFGRAQEMVIRPFTPSEVAIMLRLEPAAALDAYLVAGGFPLLTESWRHGESLWEFLRRALSNPSSPLLTDGLKILAAEFPEETRAREVLDAIGAGAVTFKTIQQTADVNEVTLARSLKTLVEQKQVVMGDRPLSQLGAKGDAKYIVSDPYLRFWLRFLRDGAAEVERGRGDLVLDRIRRDWQAYAGSAIEPIVRSAIERSLPASVFGDARYCGAFWTRTHQVEVDLVGVDRLPRPRRVAFVGSIKWKDRSPFDLHDLDDLRKHRTEVPGTDDQTLLIGVSRTGFSITGLNLEVTPEMLLDFYRQLPQDAPAEED